MGRMIKTWPSRRPEIGGSNCSRHFFLQSQAPISSPVASLQLTGLYIETYHSLLLFPQLSLTFSGNSPADSISLSTLSFFFKGNLKKSMRAPPKRNGSVLMAFRLIIQTELFCHSKRPKENCLAYPTDLSHI